MSSIEMQHVDDFMVIYKNTYHKFEDKKRVLTELFNSDRFDIIYRILMQKQDPHMHDIIMYLICNIGLTDNTNIRNIFMKKTHNFMHYLYKCMIQESPNREIRNFLKINQKDLCQIAMYRRYNSDIVLTMYKAYTINGLIHYIKKLKINDYDLRDLVKFIHHSKTKINRHDIDQIYGGLIQFYIPRFLSMDHRFRLKYVISMMKNYIYKVNFHDITCNDMLYILDNAVKTEHDMTVFIDKIRCRFKDHTCMKIFINHILSKKKYSKYINKLIQSGKLYTMELSYILLRMYKLFKDNINPYGILKGVNEKSFTQEFIDRLYHYILFDMDILNLQTKKMHLLLSPKLVAMVIQTGGKERSFLVRKIHQTPSWYKTRILDAIIRSKNNKISPHFMGLYELLLCDEDVFKPLVNEETLLKIIINKRILEDNILLDFINNNMIRSLKKWFTTPDNQARFIITYVNIPHNQSHIFDDTFERCLKDYVFNTESPDLLRYVDNIKKRLNYELDPITQRVVNAVREIHNFAKNKT